MFRRWLWKRGTEMILIVGSARSAHGMRKRQSSLSDWVNSDATVTREWFDLLETAARDREITTIRERLARLESEKAKLEARRRCPLPEEDRKSWADRQNDANDPGTDVAPM